MSEWTVLLDRITRRDESALAELYRQSGPVMFGTIRQIVKDPMKAEEAAQDLYHQVWIHADSYHPDRGTPAAWLTMLARSRAIDRVRRDRKSAQDCSLDEQLLPARHWKSKDRHEEAWRQRLVRRMMDELPPHQRVLIEMAYFEGYSQQEIATETGLPLGTVKTRIRTALAHFRAVLTAPSDT